MAEHIQRLNSVISDGVKPMVNTQISTNNDFNNNNETIENNCALFSSFEIPPETTDTVLALCASNGLSRKINWLIHPPDQVLQGLNAFDAYLFDIQIIVCIDEKENVQFIDSLLRALEKTNYKWKSIPLVILELQIKEMSNKSALHLLKSGSRPVMHRIIKIKSEEYEFFAFNNYNMPLNSSGYEKLAGSICRGILAAFRSATIKAIAVDADNTLWKGECARGPVVVTPQHKYFQQFLLEKYQEGFLLVLLSKNWEQDVHNAFINQADDHILRLNNFVKIVVNWNAKSDNLCDVAKELNISIDSFAFFDDSILECSSMISCHPQVLSIMIPPTLSQLRGMLDGLWCFDSFCKSNDSSPRSLYYHQEQKRKLNISEENGSLHDVLLSWNMVLKLHQTTPNILNQFHPDAFARADELIRSTNQFKTNTSITSLSCNDNSNCLIAYLQDDFGMYGMISVVLFTIDEQSMKISQWVINCRALSRGVEQNIFQYLVNHCRNEGCDDIYITFAKSERNEPAFKFLEECRFLDENEENIYNMHVKVNECSFSEQLRVIKTIYLSELESSVIRNGSFENNATFSVASNAYLVEETDDDFREASKWIKNWPKELRNQTKICYFDPLLTRDEATFNENETTDPVSLLRQTWIELLSTEPENESKFFESGGTSFKAVFLVSKIRQVLGVDLRLSHIYEFKTFKDFSEAIKEFPPTQEISPLIVNESVLSSIQSRLARLQELTPHSTNYTGTVAVRSKNNVDCGDILAKICSKFTYLTTVFDEDECGEKIASKISLKDFSTLILPTIETSDIETGLNLLRECTPSFEISKQQPLLKIRKVEVSNSEFLIALHVHHILVDDISLNMIEKTLSQIVNGISFECPAPKDSYSLHTAQEFSYLSSNCKSNDLQKMAVMMENLPDCAELGFEIDEWQDTRIYRADTQTVEIKIDLQNICTEYNIRPFHFYLSCYLLTLERYAGQHDLLVAIPVTTRTSQFEYCIGPFINTMLFRKEIDMKSNFATFLQDVRNTWISTQDCARLPLDKLIYHLRASQGNMDALPCNNMFNYSQLTPDESSLFVPPLHAKLPLTFDIIDVNKQTSRFILSCATDLIDSNIANNFLQSYINCCLQVRQESKICTLPLAVIDVISDKEQKQLASFNRKLENATFKSSVYEYFQNNYESHPNKIALYSDDDAITYKKLAIMVDIIAEYLKEQIPDEVVRKYPLVLIMEKDEIAIATILAIWKIGGFFLPVSEDMQQRIDPKKTQFSILLTNLDRNKVLIDISGKSFIDVRSISENPTKVQSKEWSHDSSAVAYMMMTSGSTGEPKHCLVTHEALSILIESWRIEYSLEDLNVNILQWAQFSFDVFVGDLAKAILCVTGSLTLVLNKIRLDIEKLGLLIAKNGVTMAEFTPPFALHLVGELDNQLSLIKILVVGSDILHRNTYQQIKAKLNAGQKIYNSYGMTEATIDSTLFEGECKYETRSGLVPIGHPMRGVEVTIINPRTYLACPVGTIGEVAISGGTVAFGDVKKIKLSNGSTTFLTGDSGRWLPDGTIELVGRRDLSMFKIRGFRINARQIERIISGCLQVEQVHAFAVKTNSQGLLCAAVKLKEGSDVSETGNLIQEIVKTHLPFYMIPDITAIVDNIPLTGNGKVNLDFLRQLCLNKYYSSDETSIDIDNQPANTTEQMLLIVLSETLSLPISKIRINVNFKDQGINSLTLMRFASILSRKNIKGFGGIVDLLTYCNIRQLSKHIDGVSKTNLH